ncbi:Ataxin-10 [Gracilariopsis chorda]|uniref:Ataxin-10 n=1 Tax=Gracilariopsis chorda TaxID=448386 RepID=A0A2V3IEZ0_9FLOR|nr:Ataxin-10 [Gracilariopsis chorda]|eukprot:PXF40655.1 Ataxin-10 [Gracilariopsis chorda]
MTSAVTSETPDFDTALSQLCSDEWAPSGTHVATRHSDHVLLALLPPSRTDAGRQTLGRAPNAIPHLACVLRDPLSFHERVGELAVRLLRNLCARSKPNQTTAAQCGVHILLLDCIAQRLESDDALAAGKKLMRLVSRLQSDHDPDASRMKKPFFGFAVEFLVNFVTANATNAEAVWQKAFPTLLEQLLQCDNHAAASAAAALVHNCIAVVPHRMADIVNIWQGDRGAHTSFTDVLLRQLQKESNENALDEDEQRFSWTFMIIRRLIGADMLCDCFTALRPSLEQICSSKSHTFSPSQITLLQVVEASVGKAAETVPNSSPLIEIPKGSLLFFAELLEAALLKREGDVLHVVSSAIGSIVILTDDSDVLEQLRVRAVKVAVHVLQALSSHAANGANGVAEGVEKPSFSVKGDAAVGLKGVMMRLIAICCDECKLAQDAVRKLMGIPVVLNALSYEQDTTKNPFLREWAVLAVRNLTCGNADNAKEISGYELMGLQNDTELLEKTGLEAFVDDSGRPRLRVRKRGS